MRTNLTIKEIAQLLDISPHTIRYYEKEGLIKPADYTEAGYRLFDRDNLFRLETIVLLRESGISVKDIKEITYQSNEEQYTEILKKSYGKVMKEIERLF